MNIVVEQLLTLQNIAFGATKAGADHDKKLESIRKQIPEAVLLRFDRWVQRQRKAVAVVRNRTCGECHLSQTTATMAALAFGEQLVHCDNCGRFLYLPENEPIAAAPAPAPSRRATRPRRTAAQTGKTAGATPAVR